MMIYNKGALFEHLQYHNYDILYLKCSKKDEFPCAWLYNPCTRQQNHTPVRCTLNFGH